MTSEDINPMILKMASKLLQALKDFVTFLSLVGPFFKERGGGRENFGQKLKGALENPAGGKILFLMK